MRYIAMLFVLIIALPVTAGQLEDDINRALEHRTEEAALKTRVAISAARAIEQRTVNQDQYDVTHYNLDLTLSPSTSQLSGVVTTTATVIGNDISSVDLDLKSNMTVDSCQANGASTTFTRSGDRVTVNLPSTHTAGDEFSVEVTYHGNPAGSYFGWDSYAGQDMIWTLSEPYGARTWWPCKDINTDKAESVDIIVTVPDNLVVASQGLMVSDVDNGSTRTFTWHHNYPVVTYLVSLACYPYTVFEDYYTPQDGGEDMLLQYFVYPDHYNSVQDNYALVPDMISRFAEGYGEYPFVDEKYGHAEFTWGGGMEHQTISSMGGWSEDLISHELGHQWWGDMITCADFGHIWLNEGFATWSEAYWIEQASGWSTYMAYMDGAAYMGSGTIIVEDPNDFWGIFDSNLSYNKASWVVHMLRGALGDDAFFQALKDYRAEYIYSSATTEQFRDAVEQSSGVELDDFFQQWIYGEYFPVYRSGWGQTGSELTVQIEQVQTNTDLFHMPITLRVTTDVETTDLIVDNSLIDETYSFTVNGTVTSVQVDPDGWILKQVETSVTNPSFDSGILVVNGVDWGVYDPDIQNAYEAEVFWGDLEFDFWDCFASPGSYPSTLPTPIGHGAVPGDIIGNYSTVVWVGNNYNGDLAKWQSTPILSYLESGGNLLLMSRRSNYFFDTELKDYLGISFTNYDGTLGNCTAVYPGLVDVAFTGSQSWNDVYSMSVGANTSLLFKDTTGFGSDRGTGAIVIPPEGGTYRPDGGKFAHIAGRSYRMNHAQLQQNIVFILEEFMGEPYSSISAVELPVGRAKLLGNSPNPFNPMTEIKFSLPTQSTIEISVYDVAGRKVRSLHSGDYPAGVNSVRWDGTTDNGNSVSSGTYLVRLSGNGFADTRSVMLVK
jgi:aminopeptidase N